MTDSSETRRRAIRNGTGVVAHSAVRERVVRIGFATITVSVDTVAVGPIAGRDRAAAIHADRGSIGRGAHPSTLTAVVAIADRILAPVLTGAAAQPTTATAVVFIGSTVAIVIEPIAHLVLRLACKVAAWGVVGAGIDLKRFCWTEYAVVAEIDVRIGK